MRNKKGQVLVETAIVLPILFVLMFSLVELGYLLYVKNSLVNAAALGARVAVLTQPLTLQAASPLFSTSGEPAATMRKDIEDKFKNINSYNTITYQLRLSNSGTAITGAGTQAMPGNQVQVTLTWPNFPMLTPLYKVLYLITGESPPSSALPIIAEASMRYE
jgi:Flp pilus assembly protein TadG